MICDVTCEVTCDVSCETRHMGREIRDIGDVRLSDICDTRCTMYYARCTMGYAKSVITRCGVMR